LSEAPAIAGDIPKYEVKKIAPVAWHIVAKRLNRFRFWALFSFSTSEAQLFFSEVDDGA